MYRVDSREESKRRRIIIWCLIFIVIVALIIFGILWVRNKLKPKVVLKQGHAVISSVSESSVNKLYNETDFSISIPSTWKMIPRPIGPYQSFTWEASDGEEIVIFEDTIPENLAVNRALIVTPETDHLNIDGTASDNCANFTEGNSHAPGQVGVIAEWDGVNFLCDKSNTERDVLGTSSVDGINTVVLKSPSTDTSHKFFFTYTDYSLSPDYTVFYNALNSFQMN
jgi:hypothetical protein